MKFLGVLALVAGSVLMGGSSANAARPLIELCGLSGGTYATTYWTACHSPGERVQYLQAGQTKTYCVEFGRTVYFGSTGGIWRIGSCPT
jgi:hypothetical protein